MWAKFFGSWIQPIQVRPGHAVEMHTVVNPICFKGATHNPHPAALRGHQTLVLVLSAGKGLVTPEPSKGLWEGPSHL